MSIFLLTKERTPHVSDGSQNLLIGSIKGQGCRLQLVVQRLELEQGKLQAARHEHLRLACGGALGDLYYRSVVEHHLPNRLLLKKKEKTMPAGIPIGAIKGEVYSWCKHQANTHCQTRKSPRGSSVGFSAGGFNPKF